MSQRLPPPTPPACLVRAYPSSQKGGTLIAEDVTDWKTHQRRICDPDGYRPDFCPRCQHSVLHVHDYRTRLLAAEAGRPVAVIIRHRCAHPDCRATWQILPLLIARHLWRSWTVVQRALSKKRHPNQPEVPSRTRRRWRARLKTSARMIISGLAASGTQALEKLAAIVGLEGTREELVGYWGGDLASLAGLIHRLMPGVRLM